MEFSCVFFLQEIGGVEFSAGGGAFIFSPFIVRCCEESFQAGPCFLLCGQTFSGFAVVYKETGLVDELESDADDLFEAVGSVTSEKGFYWLVCIIGGAEDSVIFL